MRHVFMVRHGYKILCVLTVVFVLFGLFDDNVLGGPHLCGIVIRSNTEKTLFSLRSFCHCHFKTLKVPRSGV